MKNIEKIGDYKQVRKYKNDTVQVFYAKVDSENFKIDNVEIIEGRWFAPHEFPKDCAPRMFEVVSILHTFYARN